ncbi:unnamed protein product [Heligmosomoides polygyrus]|uniref:PRP21_like_P domain-containing protein n=1 Tax=Heligmosomoides polygyrus TaxID=6339 RepID=A0A183GUZ4_HELPZ|nr:unnamed protein product [Heligmosomoides polygyrus]
MTAKLAETNILLRKINYNTARPSEEEPNFALMSKEKVARIRKLRGDNMTKFALDMENELFAGDREELEKPIEKRIESADKVQFIREEDALQTFVSPELLDESNQYKWNSKQDAHKGFGVTEFPYLLTIPLKQLHFDINTVQDKAER